jgi:hypothetical protein
MQNCTFLANIFSFVIQNLIQDVQWIYCLQDTPQNPPLVGTWWIKFPTSTKAKYFQ